ncbi:MAG: PAS domain S-box protein, partial [Bacillota bacterium]
MKKEKHKNIPVDLAKFSLNKAPIGIFWVSPNGEIKSYNDRVCEVLKYDDEEILNKKITKVETSYTDENRDEFWNKLKENGMIKFETTHLTKSGIEFPVEVRSQYLKYNGKEYELIFAQDISKRKEAKEKLKYSQKRYKTIFNSAPIGIIIEDKKGNILEVNESMSDMSGYKKEELEDSNIIDKFVLPKFRDLARENIKKLINGVNLEYDIKTPKKNGEIKHYHLKETNIILPSGDKGIISMHHDVTERKKLEKDLKEKNNLLNSVLESIQDGISVLNPDLTIRYTNSKMKEWYKHGLPFKGEKCFKGYYNKDERCDDCPVIKSLETAEMVREVKKLSEKFVIDYIEIFSYPIFSEDNNEITGIVEFVRDISDRKEKEKEINYIIYKDSLTGLYNRRFFEAEMERLDTKRQLPLSIIMGDLNGLKIINDSYGHEKGDQMLIETAKMLKEVLREEDILARHGGDEFTILLPKTSNEEAEKIVRRINNRNKKIGKDQIPISIGMGVATKNKDEENIKDILKEADNNMYKNKLAESRSTKNKIVENLVNTLGAKSSETKEHAIRMTKLAYELGNKIGLSNSEINRLSLLATLHDIGKTTISEEILTKPAKLTEKEWELIKEHPQRGYKIASASEEFALIAEEILSHHEKWDGSGYPNGLKR